MNNDYKAIRKQLASISRSTVSVVLQDETVTFNFTRPAPVVNAKERIQVSHSDTLSYADVETWPTKQVLNYARSIRVKMENLITDQVRGVNQSRCCNSSLHSRGWHHDTNCPNYVVKF